MIKRKNVLTTQEMAQYCHVTTRTIAQWIREGKIKAYTTPGRHNRVKRENFIHFLKEYHIPIPKEIDDDAGGKMKILVVDDDHAMVSSIQRVLEMDGRFKIAVAYNGFEAGQKFIEEKPDLVIVDYRMPKGNGYQLCRAIRNDPKNEDVRILLISGIDCGSIEKIREMGANEYLRKPFDNDTLKAKVVEMLGVA